jgi:hypothetical protein
VQRVSRPFDGASVAVSVCGINETFTFGGDTVVAHGFTGAPGPAAGNVNLTLKPFPLNVLAERHRGPGQQYGDDVHQF